MSRSMMNFLKTLTFTVLVPGSTAVGVPYFLLSPHAGLEFGSFALMGILSIGVGGVFYLWSA